MAKKGNIVLHWLLVILMVIQPAFFAHAMASMDHGGTLQMQTMDHGSHHDDHHSHDDGQGFSVDNCCHAPACGPALIVDMTALMPPLPPHYPPVADHALYDVDLPPQLEPPRASL